MLIYFRKFMHLLTRLRLEAKIFLVISFIFGLCFVFVSPPMKAPDEPQHYYRSYEISELDVVATKYSNGRYGYNLPDNVGAFGEQFLIREERHLPPEINTIRKLNTETASKQRREINFENTAVYSPMGYIFSALGIKLANLFHYSILKGYYLGRALNLSFYVALVVIAISIAPAFRWILLTVSLLPMSLFQAASFSPDATTNGLACLAVGLYLYLLNKHRVNIHNLLVSLAVLVPLALTKQIYLLLFLPYMFLPRQKFASTKRHVLWLIAVALLPLTFSLVWAGLSFDISSKIAVMFQLGPNVSVIEQLKYVLIHPLSYIHILGATLFGGQSVYLLKGVLGLLGWATISLPYYIYLAIVVTLALSIVADAGVVKNHFLSRVNRLALGLTGILIALGICTLLYLTFTPMGLPRINGLQGRYFIPSLFLLLPTLVSKKFVLSVSKRNFAIIQTVTICLILTASLIVLYKETFMKSLV